LRSTELDNGGKGDDYDNDEDDDDDNYKDNNTALNKFLKNIKKEAWQIH